MAVTGWSAFDEGYLRAYQGSQALAAGAPLPQETSPIPLGPGEIAHARFAPVALAGFFGENRDARTGFFLVGGPVGLAVTGAASLAYNAKKKAEAQKAAVPTWHPLGSADLVLTNQRLVALSGGRTGAFWYAETSPLELTSGTGGVPAVQFQPSGQPVLRVETAWAPLVFVFAHHLTDGRPPGVPVPPGLLDRAQAQGRL